MLLFNTFKVTVNSSLRLSGSRDVKLLIMFTVIFLQGKIMTEESLCIPVLGTVYIMQTLDRELQIIYRLNIPISAYNSTGITI